MTNIDTIFKRIHRYYESIASVQSDIDNNRAVLISYVNLVRILDRYLNRNLIEKGVSGPLYYIHTGLTEALPEPRALATRNMIIVSSKSLFEENYGHFFVILCLGSSLVSSNLTGMFVQEGYKGLPCIYMYIHMDEIDYNFGQVTRERFKNIVSNNFDVRKTYVHEAKHYTDWITALVKNPLADPMRSYKNYREHLSKEEQKQFSRNITDDYSIYINQMSEVNARYAEWLTAILYSFDSLAPVKKHGIIGAFPTFKDFWDYMWAKHAPEEFIEYASPKVIKYLQRRLYKFYDYVRDRDQPPRKSEVRRLVQEYLKRDKTNAT